MKWSLQQLQKYSSKPLSFDDVIDFQDYAKDVSDIIEIKPVHVTGEITVIKYGTYKIRYNVDALLILECALTLEPVEYHFEKEYVEVFSTDPTEEDFLIEKNTIDLDNAVWSNIIIDKPLVVTRDDAYEILKERGIVINESEDDIID